MMMTGIEGQNVVPLSSYQGDMKLSVLKQVEGYWHGLRDGRAVPHRSDIDPRGIETALENAFMLERIAPGLARFRLAGMHLVDLMGMEVRGMPLSAFFVPEARRKVAEALERMFDGPEIVELTLSAESGIGKPSLNARMLLLPMQSRLGDVSQVLGCLVSDGQIGRTPRRFGVTGVQCRPVTGVAAAVARAPVAGFAEPQRGFARATKPGAPFLRLVKSEE